MKKISWKQTKAHEKMQKTFRVKYSDNLKSQMNLKFFSVLSQPFTKKTLKRYLDK